MNKDYRRIFPNWKKIKETGIILNCWLIWYFAPKQIFIYYLYSINRFCNKTHKFTMLGLKIDFHLSTFIAHTIFIIHFSKLHIVSLLVFLTTLTFAWKVENIFFFLNSCLKLNQSNNKIANLLTNILGIVWTLKHLEWKSA